MSQVGVFLFFSLLSWFNYSVLAWIGMVKERVYITWISCVLTIITAYILLKLYGVYWAWIAFWLSNVYNRWLSLFLLKKEKYSFKFNWEFIIRNILLFIILWIVIFLWKEYFIDIDGNRWYMIGKLVIIGLVFYGIIGLGNIGMIKRLKGEILNLRK